MNQTAEGTKTRLASLDAFRGFTMLWLVGGSGLLMALCPLLPQPIGQFLTYEWQHSEWEGLRFMDLIWPSFMLMVGASIPFAWAKHSQTQSRRQFLLHALKRAIVLFLLGSFRASMSDGAPTLIELSSALQPIAAAYLVAALLASASAKTQVLAATVILGGYALLLALVPAHGVSAGSYEINANLVRTLDLAVLGRVHEAGWGTVLSTFPTLATTIIGLLLGELLMTGLSPGKKAGLMVLVGLAAIGFGWALSPVIPVIMKLWTTTYGLMSAGWACLFFAAFYLVIDVWGWQRCALPLVVIGVNALAAYLGPTLIHTGRIVGIFTEGIAGHLGMYGPAFSTGAVLLLNWAILWWMYKRKIFLRP